MASLEELERAENDVLALLTVTAETAKELQALPACDAEKLSLLSSQFVELGRSIQRRLVDVRPTSASSSSSSCGSSGSNQGSAADAAIQADAEAIHALQKLILASSSSSSSSST